MSAAQAAAPVAPPLTTSWRGGPGRKPAWGRILSVVFLLVGGSIGGALVYATLPASPTAVAPTGPGIAVTVEGGPLASPLVSATSSPPQTSVQVYSFVPGQSPATDVPLTGLNATNNSRQDLLFRGSTNYPGNLTGNLSTTFYYVDQLWRATLTPITRDVSLQVYVTLTVPQANGTNAVYLSWNNLPYDPRAPPSLFHVTADFLAAPTFYAPTVAGTALTPSELIGGGGCSGSVWQEVGSTWITDGILPLAIANVTEATVPTIVDYSFTQVSTTYQVSFNSNAVTYSNTSTGPITMSTDPSWTSGTLNVSATAQSSDANNGNPYTPLTVIAFENVEMSIVKYQYATYEVVNGQCEENLSDQYMTSFQIEGMNSSGFTIGALTLTQVFGAWWVHYETSPRVEAALLADNTSAKLYLWNDMTSETAYANAQTAYQGVVDASAWIISELGLALALDGVLGLLPGAGAAANAADLAGLMLSIAGLTDRILSAISGISFSTTTSTYFEDVEYNIGPASQPASFWMYEAGVPATITVQGSVYSPYMPIPYVIATPYQSGQPPS